MSEASPARKVTEIVGRFEDGHEYEYLAASAEGAESVDLRDLLPPEAFSAHGRFRVTVEFIPEPEATKKAAPRYRSSPLEKRMMEAITPLMLKDAERARHKAIETQIALSKGMLRMGNTISWQVQAKRLPPNPRTDGHVHGL